MATSNKTIFSAVGFLIIAGIIFAVYYFVFRSNSDSLDPGIEPAGFSSSSGLPDGDLQALAQSNDEFLLLLDALKGIELKSDLFSSDVFNKRLKDSSFVLEPEKAGRENPFIPI